MTHYLVFVSFRGWNCIENHTDTPEVTRQYSVHKRPLSWEGNEWTKKETKCIRNHRGLRRNKKLYRLSELLKCAGNQKTKKN